MRIVVSCMVTLMLVTAGAAAAGRGPTLARWGTDGVTSMNAIAAICLVSALVAMIPLAITALRWPAHIGQAALGGTVLRLLLTMAGAGIYQTLFDPQMGSFLFWAVVFYCLLLAVETGFGVVLVNRYYRPTSARRETAA